MDGGSAEIAGANILPTSASLLELSGTVAQTVMGATKVRSTVRSLPAQASDSLAALFAYFFLLCRKSQWRAGPLPAIGVKGRAPL